MSKLNHCIKVRFKITSDTLSACVTDIQVVGKKYTSRYKNTAVDSKVFIISVCVCARERVKKTH